jgi:hypothetical protein
MESGSMISPVCSVDSAPSMKLTVGIGRLLSRVSLVGRSKFGPSSSWIKWRHLVVNCRGLGVVMKRETHKNLGFAI